MPKQELLAKHTTLSCFAAENTSQAYVLCYKVLHLRCFLVSFFIPSFKYENVGDNGMFSLIKLQFIECLSFLSKIKVESENTDHNIINLS